MLTLKTIKISAKEEGFSLCGVTRVEHLSSSREHIERWLESGQGDLLPYMARHKELRVDAQGLLDGAQTVVVCAMNYKNEWSLNQSEGEGKVASYSLMRDYHKTMRKRLKQLLKRVQSLSPLTKGRACVDSAPILEKHYAQAAGLGWIGRQSLLITPQYGSFVVLGILLLDTPCESYDTPLLGVGCGECRRCVEACPTGAIQPTPSPLFNTIDSRRCISALTVESQNPEGRELHGWLFGCDQCQSCCPYNRRSPLSSDEDFTPIYQPPHHFKQRRGER